MEQQHTPPSTTFCLFQDAMFSPFERENITVLIDSVHGGNVLASYCSHRSNTRPVAQKLSTWRERPGVASLAWWGRGHWRSKPGLQLQHQGRLHLHTHCIPTASCGIVQGQVLLESTSPSDISGVSLSKQTLGCYQSAVCEQDSWTN